MKYIKKYLLKCHWIACQLGFDFFKFFKSLKGIVRYFLDYYTFKKMSDQIINIKPCINDYYEESGDINSEYFWQDLFVAQLIYKDMPENHIDIGSRIDGFVAHVASYRKIDVIDIRPIFTKIPNVNFLQADLMSKNLTNLNSYNSLSCLHTLEHFGLGRYGDRIDPNGYLLGIKNMSNLILPNGKFYLSTPIGRERVEFNANRVFDPSAIINSIINEGFKLYEFYTIKCGNVIIKQEFSITNLKSLAKEEYNLGIFIFIKNEI